MPARAGRKRKDGEREASGRLSQAVKRAMEPNSPAEVKRLRDASLAEMRDPAFGWQIGRYWLEKRLDAHEFEAGKRLRHLIEAYRKAAGIPSPHPRSTLPMLEARGHDPSPDSERGRAEAERAVALAGALTAAVGSITPGVVRQTVIEVVERDIACVGPHGMAWLRHGLGELATHLKIQSGGR